MPLAYARWGDPEYLKDAKQIRRYMKDFLTSPEGVFYTSQDADLVPGEHSEEYFALDDDGRRKKGIPRVDTHVYSRENGWAIQALATLYAVTGEKEHLDDAVSRQRIGSSPIARCRAEDFLMTKKTSRVPILATPFRWATPSLLSTR